MLYKGIQLQEINLMCMDLDWGEVAGAPGEHPCWDRNAARQLSQPLQRCAALLEKKILLFLQIFFNLLYTQKPHGPGIIEG